MNKSRCNICGESNGKIFMAVDTAPPIQNNFQLTPQASLDFPRIKAQYYWCNSCTHISIDKDKPANFDPNYNNEPVKFGVTANQLLEVSELIKKKLPDRQSKIVEIGCGRGELIKILNKSGFKNTTGFDPVLPADDPKLGLRSEYWGNEKKNYDIDLLIIRHTLEEIDVLDEFIEKINRHNIKNIYIEITNAVHLFVRKDYFSLYTEYSNLFSIQSLGKLFSNKYAISGVQEYFSERWLGLWLVNLSIKEQSEKYSQLISHLRNIVKNRLDKPVVLWGAAGRGGMFLASCKIDSEIIQYVVDQNHDKQGKYIPPYGQEIIPSERLDELRPGTVIVASKKFIEEIRPLTPKGFQIVSLEDLSEFVNDN